MNIRENFSFHSSMVEQKSVNFSVECSNHSESFSGLVKRYNIIIRLLYYRFKSYIHFISDYNQFGKVPLLGRGIFMFKS
jgi:hypothetical protein